MQEFDEKSLKQTPKSDIEYFNITLAKSLTYNNLKQKVILD